MLRSHTLKKLTNLSLIRGRSHILHPWIMTHFSSIEQIESNARKVMETATKATNNQDKEKIFKDFCEKIWKVYEYEEMRRTSAQKRDKEFSLATMTSRTPLKDSLRIYEAFQREVFDDEHLAASISQLAKVVRVFEEKPSYYHDLTVRFCKQKSI